MGTSETDPRGSYTTMADLQSLPGCKPGAYPKSSYGKPGSRWELDLTFLPEAFSSFELAEHVDELVSAAKAIVEPLAFRAVEGSSLWKDLKKAPAEGMGVSLASEPVKLLHSPLVQAKVFNPAMGVEITPLEVYCKFMTIGESMTWPKSKDVDWDIVQNSHGILAFHGQAIALKESSLKEDWDTAKELLRSEFPYLVGDRFSPSMYTEATEAGVNGAEVYGLFKAINDESTDPLPYCEVKETPEEG